MKPAFFAFRLSPFAFRLSPFAFRLSPFAFRHSRYNQQLDISFEYFRRPTNSNSIATGFGIIPSYIHLTGNNMGNQVEREHSKSDLILPWVIVG
ncbi:MAG: hypothetical protein PHD39_09750, partial [Methylobacter tundripaludum]|nr:hypothetical protein [Methylobacter tundripaludum]